MAATLKHLGNSSRWWAAPPRTEGVPTTVFKLTAAGLALVWLLLTGWTVAKVVIVGSPDEAANAYFMQHLAATGNYRVDTRLPAETLTYLHPRSIAVQGSFLAPGSFLGLVQIGALVIKLFGVGAEKFLTPLLSLVGLVAIFFVFRRFWGRWWSLLGVVLIALHPAFFEFATLPYLHNGAFVAVLLIAGWALLRLLERPSWISSALFGLCFGGALFFRPVEGLWTIPVVIILLLARRLWRELLFVGVVVSLVQLPWLVVNRNIFGSIFSSGYTPSGIFSDSTGVISVAAPTELLFTPAGGQWSWHWLSSVWWYYVLLLPAWSLMAIVALGRYFRRKFTSFSKAVKLVGLSLIGLFPFVYYGSWNLYPNTAASVNGALASYVRYWVVLYIAMAPGVILVLRSLSRRWLVWLTAVVMIISQLVIIWTQPVAGLRARFAADQKYRQERTVVLAATESNAVIIAGSHDKYFQAERMSGFSLPSTPSEWQSLKDMAARRPVYLYAAVGQYHLEDVQAQFSNQQLQLAPRMTIGRDVLFSILPQ